MIVKEVMRTNVVFISSETKITEAKNIMMENKFSKLPVVDYGKLVGIVTKNDLLKAEPSLATTLDMFEIDPDESQTPYWESVVKQLEELRQKYNETKDYHWFRCMKQQLPAAFRQTRTCTFSYENVRATLGQRHNHRLSEWSHDYVAWAHTLPYAEELLF